MSLANVYHVRRVAETSTKACMICYKPSSTVMITPDNKDFFYVCPAHLEDRHFCSPIIDTEGQAKRLREEAMAKEIERVKEEYKEKQRKKERAKAAKEKDEKDKVTDGSNEKEGANPEADRDQKERDKKIASIREDNSMRTTSDESPRVFSLHKNFYQMRIERLRNIEMAKRNQERMKNPGLFPSVPSENPKRV